MKIWRKARFLKKDPKIENIVNSYVNYIYKDGPIQEIGKKYRIEIGDLIKLNQYTADRIAGLLVLYMAKDYKRLNDIIIRYHNKQLLVGDIIPEIEGYIEK